MAAKWHKTWDESKILNPRASRETQVQASRWIHHLAMADKYTKKRAKR